MEAAHRSLSAPAGVNLWPIIRAPPWPLPDRPGAAFDMPFPGFDMP
jgi:hypothetical protein